VIDPKTIPKIEFNERDFEIEWYSGTGCGGQNRNKVQSSCRLTHIPTGIAATAQTRSRENSLKAAKETLLQRLNDEFNQRAKSEVSLDRKSQVGSGMRGDKRRTYRFQDDRVKDDLTGKEASLSKVMNGEFNLLW